MIDQTKNLCYIITVHYLIKNGLGVTKSKQKQFISLHGINTGTCREFALNKARKAKGFYDFPEDWIDQVTIPLSDYCR